MLDFFFFCCNIFIMKNGMYSRYDMESYPEGWYSFPEEVDGKEQFNSYYLIENFFFGPIEKGSLSDPEALQFQKLCRRIVEKQRENLYDNHLDVQFKMVQPDLQAFDVMRFLKESNVSLLDIKFND